MKSGYEDLLKTRNFLFLWLSQILSQLTINILNFVLLVRLFETTKSSIATSLLWISYSIPAIIFGPLAATLVDLVDKKLVLIVANISQSLIVFIFAFLYKSSLFLTYSLAFGYSFFNQFYVPAEQSSLTTLVKSKDLPNANSLFFITQQGSLILGFSLASLLIKLVGFMDLLLLCSLLLFVAFLSVRSLPRIVSSDSISLNFESGFLDFFERIVQGYRLIKSERKILAPLVLLLIMQVIMSVILVNFPQIVSDVFMISLKRSGIFLVIPAALGALISGSIIPKLLRKGVRKIKVIQRSMGILVICFFTLLIILPLLPHYLRFIVRSIIMILIGFSYVGVIIPSQTFLQEKTPNGFRGRVFGNYWFFVTIATIFPVLLSGIISEILGIELLLYLIGGFFLAILFFLIRKGENFFYRSIS